MTKALFFDIDGTLVSFETHRIPPSTIEALEAAHAKGLKIFIATGRPKAIINNLSELQDRNLIDGYITMNGAYCFVGEQVIYKSAIPQEEVKAMAIEAAHIVPQVRYVGWDIAISEKGPCLIEGNEYPGHVFYVFAEHHPDGKGCRHIFESVMD